MGGDAYQHEEQEGLAPVFRRRTRAARRDEFVYGQIEMRGNGGSAFRGMYADFVEQSAGVLNKPALKKVAEQFREAEASWHAVALAALPDSIPVLKQTRDAFDRRATLLQKPRTAKIDEELDSIRTRLKELRDSSTKDWTSPRKTSWIYFQISAPESSKPRPSSARRLPTSANSSNRS